MRQIEQIQPALRDRSIGGWLFCNHYHRDAMAHRILGLPDFLMVSKTWFYLVPEHGGPIAVTSIQQFHPDSLLGTKNVYGTRHGLVDRLREMLWSGRFTMRFSPDNMIFRWAIVDPITVDLIRKVGKNVVGAANRVAPFEVT
jgi:Xaa-Pro dipeptidase